MRPSRLAPAASRLALVALVALATASLGAAPDGGTPLITAPPHEAEATSLPRTGQAQLSSRLPPYPGAPEPVHIGETLTTNGVPMNLQTFDTPDDPRKVLAFYKDAFAKLHLPVLGDGDLLVRFPFPSITAFDDENGVDLSVIAMRNQGKDTTTVFLALADMDGLHDNVEKALAEPFRGLPPYPDAEAPRAMSSSDREREQVVVRFATDDGPEKVLAFYAEALGKQGFTRADDSADALTVRSPSGTWRVLADRDAKKGKTAVMAVWSSHAPSEETSP